MRTVDEIQQEARDFKALCRRVFSGGEGKQLMDHLQRYYVDIKLYADNDRAMIYNVAQRDLVMEMKNHALPADIEEVE